MNKIFKSTAVKWFWIVTALHYICISVQIYMSLPFTGQISDIGGILYGIARSLFFVEFVYILYWIFVPMHLAQFFLLAACLDKCDKRDIPLFLLGVVLTAAGVYFTYHACLTCRQAIWI